MAAMLTFRCMMPTNTIVRDGSTVRNIQIVARMQHGRSCSRLMFLQGDSMRPSEREDPAGPTSQQQEQEEERRKLRRLQVMMNMVMSVISQDQGLTVEEAAELVANTKRAALAMFPDKEFAYDILYKPRLQRLMAERFRLQ